MKPFVFRSTLLIVSTLILLSGCKQSSDVVSNGWIQKRKYRHGFHVNLGLIKDKSHANNRNDSLGIRNRMTPLKRTLTLKMAALSRSELGSLPRVKKNEIKVNLPPKEESDHFDKKEEEEPSEKSSKKTKIKTAAWGLTSVAAIILTIYSWVNISSLFGVIISALFLFMTPMFGLLALVAGSMAIYNLIEMIKQNKGKTLKTDRFFRNFGNMAFGLGIASLVFIVLSLITLGLVLFMISQATAQTVGGFLVLLALGALLLFFAGLFLFFYVLLSWPTVTGSLIAFKKSKKARIGFILWLISFLLLTTFILTFLII